uniref:ITPR-interacting domain-containing protein n=1 Tax=Echeneis naucrates TaxID=173247 RepID=A0A665X6E2_ECHNA
MKEHTIKTQSSLFQTREEVLMDLGFGCDELDLSGRIPARFINHQSQARGINLQVFLEAQKNRLDLENPDVSCKFLITLTSGPVCLNGWW